MKSINNIFKKVCILAVVASMAGCDMLDTKPYDFVAPETFYKNGTDCTMALAGVQDDGSRTCIWKPLFLHVIQY